MRTQRLVVSALLVIAANLCVSAQVLASRLADIVTGKVTALPGGAQLVVDGKTYYLRLDGQALAQLQSVRVGETVDLALDGPPQATASKVVTIREHVGK